MKIVLIAGKLDYPNLPCAKALQWMFDAGIFTSLKNLDDIYEACVGLTDRERRTFPEHLYPDKFATIPSAEQEFQRDIASIIYDNLSKNLREACRKVSTGKNISDEDEAELIKRGIIIVGSQNNGRQNIGIPTEFMREFNTCSFLYITRFKPTL